VLTPSQRRAWDRHGNREIQRTIDAARRDLAAEAAERRAAAKAAEAQRRQPADYSLEDLKAATHVRTELGWHRVVRVSAKSVTVRTDHSWNDRYPLSKILDVRAIEEKTT
jgi:hypothetical protein